MVGELHVLSSFIIHVMHKVLLLSQHTTLWGTWLIMLWRSVSVRVTNLAVVCTVWGVSPHFDRHWPKIPFRCTQGSNVMMIMMPEARRVRLPVVQNMDRSKKHGSKGQREGRTVQLFWWMQRSHSWSRGSHQMWLLPLHLKKPSHARIHVSYPLRGAAPTLRQACLLCCWKGSHKLRASIYTTSLWLIKHNMVAFVLFCSHFAIANGKEYSKK